MNRDKNQDKVQGDQSTEARGNFAESQSNEFVGFFPMENKIQPYDWGSKDGLRRYAGVKTAKDKPAAEYWMGAHPVAQSLITTMDGQRIPLDEFIRTYPVATLGQDISQRFGELPFLFKALSAAKPLSIQVHPSKEKARAGFEEENAQGVPLDSPERNYKDPNHKPELAVALSEFWALCGFRPACETRALLGSSLCALLNFPFEVEASSEAGSGTRSDEQAADLYVPVLQRLLTLPADIRADLEALAIKRANYILENGIVNFDNERAAKRGLGVSSRDARNAAQAVLYCFEEYPKDPGAVAPFFLSLLHLSPGQGLYIPAGVLHSYLKGTIIELMAASDNVIRGGMTSKKIDIDQLFKVLEPNAKPLLVSPKPLGKAAGVERDASADAASSEFWPVPAQEFALTKIEVHGNSGNTKTGRSFNTTNLDLPGPKILFCTKGEAHLYAQSEEEYLTQHNTITYDIILHAGESVFAADSCRRIVITGASCVYVASVPTQNSAASAAMDGDMLRAK